jgi:hypothetical protein
MKRLANYLIAMALMAFTFTSCEDVPNPFGQILPPGGAEEEAVVVPATGSGTLTDPYNVTKVVEVVSAYADNAESPTDVYIEGIVKSIKEQYGTQYGNATFDIQDVENGEASFTIYRALYLGNEKYTDDSATKLNEGDKVIICGKVTKYVNASSGQVTLETKQNAAYLYSLNGKGGGDTPAPTETIGTKDEPITVAKALELINALADGGTTDKDAYVTGKITKIITTDANIAKYKNIDYMISDGTNELKVFRGKNIDNTDFTEAGQISVGDEVVVLGKLMKYAKDGNIEPEVAQGNYLVKLTKGSGGGGGDTPTEAKGSGTESDPYNVAAIVQEAGKLEKGQTSENDVYFKGKICSIKYTFSAQYGTATFNVSDDGATGGTEFICYSVYTLGNKPWVEGNDQIAVGDVVVICGKITNYNGTLETASKKAYIVSLNKSDTGGGDTSGSDLTVTAASLGLENGVEVGTKTLTDGTTLTCAGGSNTNVPKYYSAGNGTVRMYPSNTMTLNAGSKTISSVEIVCNEYNGTLYNASGNVTTTSGAKAIDGASVKFTGINSSTVTITNAAEGSGGATQIRWESLKITYAN